MISKLVGYYSDVSERLGQVANSRTLRTEGPNDKLPFSTALGDLLAKQANQSNSLNNLQQDKHSQTEIEGHTNQRKLVRDAKDIQNAFSLSTPPDAILPPTERLQRSELDNRIANEEAPSVKTPTLLEAKRIDRTLDSAITEKEKLKKIVHQAAEKHGFEPALPIALATNESNFNPSAVSRDGHFSKGLFQLLDSTGRELLERSGIKMQYDPFNPQLNAELGVAYLSRLHQTFAQSTKLTNGLTTHAAADSSSLEKLAVAAFNAGEGRVASAQARAKQAGKDPTRYDHIEAYLPESTQQYVRKVQHTKNTLIVTTDLQIEQI